MIRVVFVQQWQLRLPLSSLPPTIAGLPWLGTYDVHVFFDDPSTGERRQCFAHSCVYDPDYDMLLLSWGALCTGEVVIVQSPHVSPPAALPGHLCEVCLDAPAVTLASAPWGGEMGLCEACVVKGGDAT